MGSSHARHLTAGYIRSYVKSAYQSIEVKDDVTAYAEYENGATGVFITSTGDAPGTNRFEVTGTLGKMIAEGKTLTFYKNSKDAAELCRNDTESGFETPEVETIVYNFEDEGPKHKGLH